MIKYKKFNNIMHVVYALERANACVEKNNDHPSSSGNEKLFINQLTIIYLQQRRLKQFISCRNALAVSNR
jgi:hypothetical protein